MSKIDEYLDKLCPEGVEVRVLSDIARLERGQKPEAEEISQGEIPVVTAALNVTEYIASANFGPNAISISSHGVNAGFVSFWESPIWLSNNVYLLLANDSVILPKFLFYILKNNERKIQELPQTGGIPYINANQILKLKFPVPPLEIQNAVVEMLDIFSKIQAELESELAARKEQFYYYRELLLAPNEEYGTKWLKVADLFDLKNGYTPDKSNSSFWESGTIPWFRIEDIRENGRRLGDSKQKITPLAVKTGKLFEAGSLLISTSASVGEFAIVSVPHLANQRFISLRLKDQYLEHIDSNYLYYLGYLIAKEASENASTSGNFPAISNTAITKFVLPIPSMEKQLKIAKKLDLFDELVSSLVTGLPAELAIRRKQYEYYRDKLLTFKELAR